MAILEDKLIELDFSPDADLFISWLNFIENSISAESSIGNIRIKYSEVPELVYFLANKIGIDFLPKNILDEAKKKDFISCSDEDYKDFCQRVNQNLQFKSGLWKLLEEDRAKDQIFDEQLRYLKELLPSCEYVGFIAPSAEYSSVDILYKDAIYLAQKKNVLKLNNNEIEEIIKRTLEHYGACISPVLRCLLERV
ncbi:MAG: hypothetical protein DRP10_02125 [Candidatus Aenigmatarchaeota archaeon]|nr:MAG: hypothetical protein DRP10_02125 [Candidatus Aenigmarchaeota archaeon]